MIKWIVLLFLCCFSYLGSFGQHVEPEKKHVKPSIFQIVNRFDEGKMILYVDIDSLRRYKQIEKELPGLFVFASYDRNTIINNYATFGCKLSARGNYRKRTCDFPPIKLNFDKDDLKDAGLKNYDDYKLVTHCMEDGTGEQTLLKEFLVYKMYEELTGYCFKTALCQVNYRDVDSDEEKNYLAFLIESEKELKDRLDAKWCDCTETPVDSIDAFHHELFAVFQYMIGNRDINIFTGHNVRLLRSKQHDKMIAIPYDFDFSLFVNANYAFPTEDKRVERLFSGAQANEHVMNQVMELFRSKKARFFSIINDFELLDRKEKKECAAYIAEFYQILEDADYRLPYFR
jgi:hypothetical protein